MKRYIRSNSDSVLTDAKSLRESVLSMLQDAGFSDFFLDVYARKPGMQGAGFGFKYRYNAPNEEYLLGKYAADFGEEEGRRVLANHQDEYSNFAAMKDFTRYVPTDEDFHDPLSHRGGGFSEMDDIFSDRVRDYVKSIRDDAIVQIGCSGFLGIYTSIIIKIFVPKSVT